MVAHRPKAGGTRADDLVIGSRAFTALARVKPRFGGGWVWRLSAPAEDASEDDRIPLTLGNLSSCHLGKNKAKNDHKLHCLDIPAPKVDLS